MTALTRHLRDHSHPINAADPEAPLDDLEWLRDVVSGAALPVSRLLIATHGSK
jgi:hypothetical protein